MYLIFDFPLFAVVFSISCRKKKEEEARSDPVGRSSSNEGNGYSNHAPRPSIKSEIINHSGDRTEEIRKARVLCRKANRIEEV